MLRHASHVLASWPAWRRRLAFARGRRAHICRATPYGCPRGRCAPTVAHRCATDSNPRERDTRSPPDRGTCAMRVQPCRRAKTHNSPHVVCASLVPAVQPRRCRTTSRDASELSELIYYHDRVGPDASAMAARHWECWAHPVPARRAGEAAAAAAGRLWVGWRSRRGGEPAHARPSGWAGGVRKRARGAEAVGGHAWVTLSDVGFVRVLQRFRVEGMFARPPSQNFGDEGIVLSW